MSREIKFRAWHNTVSHCYDVECFKADGSIVARRIVNGKVNYSALPAEGIEIEQYAGLKDKNGKDIYEGDIVKIQMSTGERVVAVVYEGAAFRVDFGDTTDWLDWYKEGIEVIGNIHENPELLKEKK